ncbi:MAG: hypothetical protein U0841_05515 [Chloroflexia bacterium]
MTEGGLTRVLLTRKPAGGSPVMLGTMLTVRPTRWTVTVAVTLFGVMVTPATRVPLASRASGVNWASKFSRRSPRPTGRATLAMRSTCVEGPRTSTWRVWMSTLPML